MSLTQQYPPLTTVFTPPSHCSTVQITSVEDLGLWQDFALELDQYNNSGKSDDPGFYCYPSGYYQGQGAFSPGIVCPLGYTELTALPISTSTSASRDQIKLTKYCCPDDLWGTTEFDRGYIGCVSKIAPPVIAWTQAMLDADTSAWVVTSLTSGVTVDLSELYHPAITLFYQPSDLPSFTIIQANTTAAESSQVTQTIRTGSITPELSSTIDHRASATSAPGNHTALNTGTRAGVSVGCILALLIVVGALIIRVRRRRQKRRMSELDDDGVPAEMMGDARAELTASKLYPSHELEGSDGKTLAGEAIVSSKSYALTEAERKTKEPEERLTYGMGGTRGIQQEDDSERQTGAEDHGVGSIEPATVSSIDRERLAARELQWLEQEENRIREQKARILAQHQR